MGPRDDAGVDAQTTISLSELPPSFPRPVIPTGEELTPERVTLGRHLFYDKRLSRNETQACASCHRQTRAFAEAREVSLGSTGESHFRNALSLANVAYRSTLSWADPSADSLASQAQVPLFGAHPVELGFVGQEALLLDRLRADERYHTLFDAAFPDLAHPMTVDTLLSALVAFQRTILSFRSPYDRFVFGGDQDAIAPAAARGLALFRSERLHCAGCHQGADLTDATQTEQTGITGAALHNTGLYNVDGLGAYPPSDRGAIDVTGQPSDMGRFRTPTLRNVELTPPYFHDGSAPTLDDVLDHYAAGGRRITEGPGAGDGATSPLRDPLIAGFTLSAEERAELIAFLLSLTDQALVEDPRLDNPWPR